MGLILGCSISVRIGSEVYDPAARLWAGPHMQGGLWAGPHMQGGCEPLPKLLSRVPHTDANTPCASPACRRTPVDSPATLGYTVR